MKSTVLGLESHYKNLENETDPGRKVGWKNISAQQIRFNQIYKLLDGQNNFDIADVGCGICGFYDYLKQLNLKFSFTGYDVLQEMVNESNKLYSKEQFFNVKKIDNFQDIASHQFVIASGIFNLRGNTDDNEWYDYILASITEINQKAKDGFAFNALTSYSDKEFMRKDLYYSDPLKLFDFCKKNFSKNVALLHDYNEYDFTIIVRK